VNDRDTRGIALRHRLVAETVGTSFLLIAIVGSGILGERLAAGNHALALLPNALATGAALFALIQWLAPLSDAHFNPLVTLAMAFRGDTTYRAAAAYVLAQMLGGFIGVGVADTMFGIPAFSLSSRVRGGPAQLLGEFVSTSGLVGIVWVCSKTRNTSSLAGAVAAYIFGVFWFTPTGFANPAVTLARAFTDTFSGIQPSAVPGFIAAEIAGAAAAVILLRWLLPSTRERGDRDEAAHPATRSLDCETEKSLPSG
jgi:glycerol uptake facilitator-like aquaporin